MRRRLAVLLTVVGMGTLGSLWWLASPYSEQVNATIRMRRALASGSWRDPRSLDQWGRAFAVYETPGCLVVVSYGADGVPDTQTYGPDTCRVEEATSSSCWWSRRDTVAVNGRLVRYCAK